MEVLELLVGRRRRHEGPVAVTGGETADDARAAEIIVVGDRVFMDFVLAHHLAHSTTLWARFVARRAQASRHLASPLSQGPGVKRRPPLAVWVWTTGVWQRESMAMRWAESRLVDFVELWVEGARQRRDSLEDQFVKSPLEYENEEAEKPVRGWFSWMRNKLARSG